MQINNSPKNKLVDKFLSEYAEYAGYQGFYSLKSNDILRQICENYDYSPQKRDIVQIALGWFLAKSDFAKATVLCCILEQELKNMYCIVAEENNWKD